MSYETIKGFKVLPAGWYNYYISSNGQVFRTPCPGFLEIQTTETDYAFGETIYTHEITFEPAELSQGKMQQAAYLDCYVETLYQGEDSLELMGDDIPPLIRFHASQKTA